jgi:WD40 repeat protein/serine/threonine protein kinase
MSNLSLAILGTYTATLDGQPLPKFPTVRAQALLIYLLVEKALNPAAQRREALMELLWPGMPPQSGRKNLRQTIYYLRQTLGDGEGHTPFLLADRYTVEINPDYPYTLDVADFSSLLAGPQDGWPTAIDLYRGDFLADFYLADSADYEAWILARREFFRRQVLDALEALTVQATRRQAYDEARSYAERQLEIDNFRERAYRQLMEILARSGYREEALAQYEACRQLLDEELGMAPARRTTEIYERIRAGDLGFDLPLAQDARGLDLKERIGEGAFGTVHRAIQLTVNREVAVKVIRQKYADDPAFIRRFEVEAQTIARLEHPHIVPLYDFWRDPEGAYLVMRYMRGGDLRTSLKGGPWEAGPALKMLQQLSAALSAAHRQGIVHRDIKPANILFDLEGGAYLSDFGIAKSLAGDEQLSATWGFMGTPEYTAPEQLKNEPISPQSDIYSLTMVLYETLTGERPFAEESIASLIHKHLHEPVPSLSASRPDLPPQIDQVIQRATAKNPADRFADALEMAEAFRNATLDADGSVAVTVPKVEVYNPYKGLRAFQEADAEEFFGREALIEQLIARLTPTPSHTHTSTRFLAVVGPSGSGKSSVVKAGLIPALRAGTIPGSENWFVAEMVPGVYPLEELEKALWPIAVDPPPSLVEPMRRDEQGLLRTIRRILPVTDGAELLLVIDQFEELFTLVDDERQRAHFVGSLLAAISNPHSPLRVIITLRADFFDRPLQIQPLGHWLKENTAVVLPMSAEELAGAIQKPARQLGIKMEEGLVASIVADVKDQPGALPLLQYALTELFDRRQDGLMTRQGYHEIGGVSGALGRRAEELYASLDAREQEAARQIFLRLVALGPGAEATRRRISRAELEEIMPATSTTQSSGREAVDGGQQAAAITQVIDTFGRFRLLTFDRDPLTREPTVEVTHEALLQEWPRLRGWLDENRNDIRLQRMLATAAAEWLAAGRDAGYLLHGTRLNQYETWLGDSSLALTRDELAYLEASLKARQQQEIEEEARHRRELETAQRLAETEKARAEEQSQAAQGLRRRALYLGVALAIAAILALAAIVAGGQANRNADLAAAEAQARATQQAIAEQNADVAQEEAAARATEQARAERSAAESHSLALASGAQAALADNETDQALALAVAANQIDNPPAFAQQMLYEAALAPGTIRRIDGEGLFRWKMDMHPGGRIVASAADDGSITLWDVETGAEIRRLEGVHSEPVGDVAFTPDGEALLSGGYDDLIVLWDIQTREVIRRMLNPSDNADPLAGDVNSLDITPDGRLVIAGSGGGVATLWDLKSGALVGKLAGHDPELQVQPAVFSPDGRLAATGSEDTTVILWDVADQSLLHRLEGHDDVVFALAFSPDGKMLASGSFDNNVILWDVASGEPLSVLEGHHDYVFDVAFNEDGTQLLSSSRDQSVIRWDVATGKPLQTYQGEAGRILSVDYIDEKRGISTASTGNLRIWALDDEMVQSNFRLTNDLLASLTQSEDGHLAAAGLNKEIRLVNLETGEVLGDFTISGEIPGDLPLSRGDVTALAFDQAAEHLLSGMDEGTIILWDVERGREMRRYEGHANRILDLAFSPDGQQFLSASDDKFMILWDVNSGDIIHRFNSPTDTINAGAFSPDGRTLAGGFGTFRYLIEGDFQDNNIHLWDAASGEEILQLTGHEGPVTALQFSADGRTLLSGSIDETVRLWDVASGEQIRRFDGHTGGVFDVAFSSDGKYAASGAADAMVIVWNVATGDRLRQLTGHEGLVHHVRFEQNGDRLWSAAEDGQLRLWNLSLDLEELLSWTQANRYLPEFTCNQRAQYRIEPLCENDK